MSAVSILDRVETLTLQRFAELAINWPLFHCRQVRDRLLPLPLLCFAIAPDVLLNRLHQFPRNLSGTGTDQ